VHSLHVYKYSLHSANVISVSFVLYTIQLTSVITDRSRDGDLNRFALTIHLRIVFVRVA